MLKGIRYNPGIKNGLDFADSDDSFDLGPNPNSIRYDQRPTNSKGNFNNLRRWNNNEW
jgi:hypothetical protein